MIDLWFNIANPWAKDTGEAYHDFYVKTVKLTQNKLFEIQIAKTNLPKILCLCVSTTLTGEDHAGPEFNIEVFGYYFGVKIYDRRHWDYETNSWEKV